MTAPAAPQYHIDSPTTRRPTQAHFDITGWIYNGPEGCLDLRAHVDGRIQYGLYGLDRPDTEANFGGVAGRRTGFIQQLQTWRGAGGVVLEFHDGERWREFFRAALDTSALPAAAVRPPLVLRTALIYQTLHFLYRHFHRESYGRICQEADRV